MLSLLVNTYVFAQLKDTLSNLTDTATLISTRYVNPGEWGYYTGHNHLNREEFAEKYYIQGTAKLLGVISYHGGTVTMPGRLVEFNAYSVSSKGLPANQIATKQSTYGNVNLNGQPTINMFSNTVNVADSFFVSFNLTDYAHDAYTDTITLLTGLNGSRHSNDTKVNGRNAIRYHSHSGPKWRDFYTQNFTPLRTHFAIYPIIEVPSVTALGSQKGTSNFQPFQCYPNPAYGDEVSFEFYLKSNQTILISLYDFTGKLLKSTQLEQRSQGQNVFTMPISDVPAGTYLSMINIDGVVYAQKVIIAK